MNKQDTQPDPRQALFLAYYLDPKSSTFSNALQSGIRAGYSEEYSQSILCKDLDWLSENVDKQNMVKKAMRNLNKLLDEDKDKRILLDTTKFVAERIGKLN
jgi:phage terminase small subunit